MIIFQTRKSRNCVSANCFNRNYKQKTKSIEPKENKNDHNAQNQQQKENFVPEFHNYKPPISCVDPFTEQMKFLIDQNSDYFQSKGKNHLIPVRITDKVRPNQYRFKIPTKTPMTLYKKNFNQKIKDRSVDNVKLNRNLLSQTIKKNQSQQKLALNTTYQVQFGLKSQYKRSKKNSFFNSRKSKEFKPDGDEQIPRFLETQNNRFFLNWGGYNSAISLKPSNQSIVTNIPLNGKTTYKNDFQGRLVTPTKLAAHQSTLSKFKNPFIINKSCYSRDFTKNQRKPQMQRNCKPQHEQLMTSSTNFKGCTEYCSQFMKLNDMNQEFSFQMDKNDLKTLIIDL